MRLELSLSAPVSLRVWHPGGLAFHVRLRWRTDLAPEELNVNSHADKVFHLSG